MTKVADTEDQKNAVRNERRTAVPRSCKPAPAPTRRNLCRSTRKFWTNALRFF